MITALVLLIALPFARIVALAMLGSTLSLAEKAHARAATLDIKWQSDAIRAGLQLTTEGARRS